MEPKRAARTKSTATNGHARAAGTFVPGELLTLPELRRRTGWGQFALRQARKRGLRIVRSGNSRYCFSDDFIKFVAETAEEEAVGLDATAETT